MDETPITANSEPHPEWTVREIVMRRDLRDADRERRKLIAEIERLRAALSEIASEDFRGPQPWASVLAQRTLNGSSAEVGA